MVRGNKLKNRNQIMKEFRKQAGKVELTIKRNNVERLRSQNIIMVVSTTVNTCAIL